MFMDVWERDKTKNKIFVMLACGQRNQGDSFCAIRSSCRAFFPDMTAKMFGHEKHWGVCTFDYEHRLDYVSEYSYLGL